MIVSRGVIGIAGLTNKIPKRHGHIVKLKHKRYDRQKVKHAL